MTKPEFIVVILAVVIFALVPLKIPPLNRVELTILVKLPLAAVMSFKFRAVVFKLVKVPFVKLALVPFTIVEVIKLESILVIFALVPLKTPPLNKGELTMFV